MIFWRALPALLALLVGASGIAADPADRLAILDAERAALKSLVFTAEIETPKPGGRTGRARVRFEYLAPDRYRSEIKLGIEGEILTVADGGTIWLWESRPRRLYRQDQAVAAARLEASGPVDPLTALATPSVPLGRLFRVESVSESGAAAALILRPIKPVPAYDRLVIVTTRDGRTPLAAESWKGRTRTAQVRFTSYRRNAAVPPARFSFTPPPGVTATEMR